MTYLQCYFLIVVLAEGWHAPYVADRAHRHETRGEVLDKVPTTMELLQLISIAAVDTPLQETHLFVPQLILDVAQKQIVSDPEAFPPSERGWRESGEKRRSLHTQT